MGQKQKTERERLNDGNNNGQATHGARKPPGPKNNLGLFMWVKIALFALGAIYLSIYLFHTSTNYDSQSTDMDTNIDLIDN